MDIQMPVETSAHASYDEMEEFDGTDLEKVSFLLQNGYDLAYAIEQYDRVVFYEAMTLKELAEQMVKGRKFTGIPQPLQHLVNCDNIVRHLKANGYVETACGVFRIEESFERGDLGRYIVFDEAV